MIQTTEAPDESDPDPAPSRVSVVRESMSGETRVAAIPTTVRQIVGLGYAVLVEPGAGEAAGFTDEAYVGPGEADVQPTLISLRVDAGWQAFPFESGENVARSQFSHGSARPDAGTCDVRGDDACAHAH
jgi:hypothetical protein